MTEQGLGEKIPATFRMLRTWLRGAAAIFSMFLVTMICTGIVLWVHSLTTYTGGDVYLSIIAILWIIFFICSFLVAHITKQKSEEVRKFWDVEDGNR